MTKEITIPVSSLLCQSGPFRETPIDDLYSD